MKPIHLTLFLLILCCTGCIKKYRFTARVCTGLYVEVFNINPAGVGLDYLTDSVNFRIRVDRFDEEHERIRYQCTGDSILILKTDQSTNNCHWIRLPDGKETVHCDLDTLSSQRFSLTALKQQHRFD